MNYIGQDYQTQRIEKNQKFLLKLLHLHIGNYYPLRKWLGIDHKGKIDEITNQSIAYDTKKVKEGYQQTRTYQQPDLGYKLNLVLDKIPQLALLPALLQPAYGLAALAFFFLTQTTYQPSTKDAYIGSGNPDTNYGTIYRVFVSNVWFSPMHWDTTDIPAGAIFSQGDILLYCEFSGGSSTVNVSRLTQLGWTEDGVTWNKYDGTNAWTTPGGDYTTTNQVGISVAGSGAWYTWNAATLIQDCYDNQSKNVHIILNSTGAAGQGFYAKDESTQTTLRPKLTVTYTVPSANTTNFFQFFN